MRRPWKDRLLVKFFLSHLGVVLLLLVVILLYEAVGSIPGAVLIGLLLTSGLWVLFAFVFSRRVERRIMRLVDFSQSVSDGLFSRASVRTGTRDELTMLEDNLNEMSRGIREKIKDIVAEKEKVESILKCMSEGVLAIDLQGRIIFLNENARGMFNLFPARSLQGVSLLEISRHPEMKRLLEAVLACDCSTQCFSREISLDEGKWFRVNAVSLRSGDEKPMGYILVFHDVTELKRLENVRADFVANVSHELRTPVTAIRGYAETLLRAPPADREEAKTFLGIIERHSERLGRLIDDLLTLSDLESGKIQLSKEAVPPADLIGRVLEIFKEQVKQKKIALSRAVEPDLPSIVGDSDRLEQLLINLIDNAVKFTPPGGQVKVTAAAAPANSEQPAMVEIAVEDTGCGIPEKDLPRLTERFYRVDKARSRELGGTGLGLAIVKHIVQGHGGRLKIESQIRTGTTVRVALPAEKKKKTKGILFLCTANSCRSQMAEGFSRELAPGGVQIYSAGTDPKEIHPLAIKAMKEAGVDISKQRSKGLDEIPLENIDLVVTLCGEAAESCPAFPQKAEPVHWPLADPALAQGDEEARLKVFRDVRDEIRARVEKLFS